MGLTVEEIRNNLSGPVIGQAKNRLPSRTVRRSGLGHTGFNVANGIAEKLYCE